MSEGIEAFFADLREHNKSENVIMLMFSKFGRHVHDNGSGTDNGAGGVAFVLGEAVRGGNYGEMPPLRTEHLVHGDLDPNMDFRSVYSTILDKWLGLNPAPIVNGIFEQPAFLAPLGSVSAHVAALPPTVRSTNTDTCPTNFADETAASPPPQAPDHGASLVPVRDSTEGELSRQVNVWTEDITAAGQPFRILVNIGMPKQSSFTSAVFPEPERSDESYAIKLMVSLSGLGCEVRPGWQELYLPRSGDTDTIKFTVLAATEGDHEFSLRVYLAQRMLVLQSLLFVVKVLSTEELVGS